MTITINTRITDDAIATAFIKQFEANVQFREDGKIRVWCGCGRCGGSGYGPWQKDGGICYECYGADTKNFYQNIPPKAYAQRLKRRLRAQEKARQRRRQAIANKIEGQRDWCEKNGFGRITFEELDVVRAQQREVEKQAAPDVPVGRGEFTVTVIKIDVKSNGWGQRVVMTCKDDRGFMLWGSVPSNFVLFKRIRVYDDGDCSVYDQETLHRGDRLTFTASASVSDDPKFGFFKRPVKAELIAAAPGYALLQSENV